MFGQDIIFLKNGDEIQSIIMEVDDTYVKYKKVSNTNGPTFRLNNSRIFKIKYENGEEDFFGIIEDEEEITSKSTRNSRSETNQSRNVQSANNQYRKTGKSGYTMSESYENAPEIPFRRVYVGLDIGGAFLFQENYGMETSGLHFAINVGVFFKPQIGISAQIFGNNFSLTKYSDLSAQHGGFIVGPLFAVPLGHQQKAEVHFKPMIGVGWANSIVDGSMKGNSFGVGFAGGFGASFRFNLGMRFALAANLDTCLGSVDDSNDYIYLSECKFNSVALSLGGYLKF
jgi:hypothetical protein